MKRVGFCLSNAITLRENIMREAEALKIIDTLKSIKPILSKDDMYRDVVRDIDESINIIEGEILTGKKINSDKLLTALNKASLILALIREILGYF